MKKKCYVFLLLIVSVSFGQQQQIDSLQSFLSNYNKEDTLRLEKLNQLIYSYYAINPKKGIEISIEAEALAKKINAKKRLATTYSYRGHNYSALGKDSLALHMYDTAIASYDKDQDKKKIARLIYNKGLVYFNQSDYKRANDCNKKAYTVFKEEGDLFLMAKMLNSIGINYMNLTSYTEALATYQEAMLLYEKLNKTNDLEYASIHGNIGLLYARLGKTAPALEYQEKALVLFKKVDYETGVANTLTNIGRIYNDLKKPKKAIQFYKDAHDIMEKNSNERGVASALTNIGQSYILLIDYNTALTYFLETKEIYQKLNNTNNLASVHKLLGECYQYQRNLPLAEQNFETAITLAKQVGNLNLQYEVLEKKALLHTAMNDYKKAYHAKSYAVVLKDSFNSVTKKEEIARLEAQHKYNQEKAILNATHEKEQAIVVSEVKRQKLFKQGIAIVASVFSISMLIGFLLYKKRKNALIAKEAAEFSTKVAETELKALRSQMNPHFIFNSLNSISNYMQKNNVTVANDYLVKFSRLTRAILENSEKKWISLQEDIELTTLYIELEQLRLKDKFSYTIKMDSSIDVENTLIPPLILQPFIENSIWHGISKKETAGYLHIEIKKDREMIHCIVDDNGVGREKSLHTKPQKNSLGMKITKNRLDIINRLKKVSGSIEIFDKTEGLRVEVKLPLELRF